MTLTLATTVDTSDPYAMFGPVIWSFIKTVMPIIGLFFVVDVGRKILRRPTYYAPPHSKPTTAASENHSRELEEKERRRVAWVRLGGRHDDVEKTWMSYQKDPAVFLKLPAMRDMALPEVQEAGSAGSDGSDVSRRRAPHQEPARNR